MPDALSTLDDRALWERVCRGDDAAWTALQDRFGPAVTALLLGRVEAGAVGGVREEVFGRARAGLPKIPNPSAVGRWLLDLARAHPSAPRPAAASGVEPMLRQVDRLDPEAKEAVLLEAAAGLDADGIARLLDTRRAEVESRLARGRRQLGEAADAAALARALAPYRYRPRPARRRGAPLLLAVTALAVAGGAYLLWKGGPGDEAGWRLAWTEGARGADRLDPGGRLETAADQRARLTMGDLGHLDVEPGTALRREAAEGSGAHLALERGALQITTSGAGGRLTVGTPKARVLGERASYLVETDAKGQGLVVVREGLLRLEAAGTPAVLVPAGATCRLLAEGGVGAPYWSDGPPELRDVTPQGALAAALSAVEPRDTLVLWHLLPRVEAGDRALLVAKIAELVPPPDGVSVEAVAALEPMALRAWEAALRKTW